MDMSANMSIMAPCAAIQVSSALGWCIIITSLNLRFLYAVGMEYARTSRRSAG